MTNIVVCYIRCTHRVFSCLYDISSIACRCTIDILIARQFFFSINSTDRSFSSSEWIAINRIIIVVVINLKTRTCEYC